MMPAAPSSPLRALESTPTWTPGPAAPKLCRGALHIWKADLEAIGDELGECLCDQERARAQLIASPSGRALWRRSRGLLRTLLGTYLGQTTAQLRFVTGPGGKPALHAAAGEEISFNLSHSRRFALVAIGRDGEVGVDIEVIRDPAADLVALAERAFGKPEARRIEALDRSSRGREFMRAWTRHEAELKRRGTGFGGHAGTEVGQPWIHELELGPELAGAVACAHPAGELCYWEWPAGAC